MLMYANCYYFGGQTNISGLKGVSGRNQLKKTKTEALMGSGTVVTWSVPPVPCARTARSTTISTPRSQVWGSKTLISYSYFFHLNTSRNLLEIFTSTRSWSESLHTEDPWYDSPPIPYLFCAKPCSISLNLQSILWSIFLWFHRWASFVVYFKEFSL